jgi:hypothetical protein
VLEEVSGIPVVECDKINLGSSGQPHLNAKRDMNQPLRPVLLGRSDGRDFTYSRIIVGRGGRLPLVNDKQLLRRPIFSITGARKELTRKEKQ